MRDMAAEQVNQNEQSAPVEQLCAEGLCFDASGQRLIDGIDLAIRPGACSVIMGANGSGKSLLLRLLHGLISPSDGRVLWHGRPLDRNARRMQAMVFQHPVMLRRSVISNMRFALKTRGVRGRDLSRRAEEALQQARLSDIASRPARVLSGGEQQRLAVARALAGQPQLLFLDEPTASLDPASTQAIEQQINQARRNGVTIVMVTHDLGQARRIGEDVLFMHDRRIVERGPLAQVLSEPKTAAAQAWLEGRLYVEGADPN